MFSGKTRYTRSLCRRHEPFFGFWLRDCKHFRVLGPYGRLGRTRVHRYSRDGDLDALHVRTGSTWRDALNDFVELLNRRAEATSSLAQPQLAPC